jgi:serine/threonine protein kinase/uncharacterized MnhB-related membrane protein
MNWTKGTLLKSGKYRIVELIKPGEITCTYLAKEQTFHQLVVIKAPSTLQNNDEYERFKKQFKNVKKILDKIRHPNVVRALEYFEDKETHIPCLVMEYIKGETLYKLLTELGRIEENDAVNYFQQLILAMHNVHQNGVVHCDLHPENIIILRRGSIPIILDFDSAKYLDDTVKIKTSNPYTPYEQTYVDKPQATLDIYALAAIFYHAATGDKPKSAESRCKGSKLKSPRHLGLSEWFSEAILLGMNVKPEDRPDSMQSWFDQIYLKRSVPLKDKVQRQPFIRRWYEHWLKVKDNNVFGSIVYKVQVGFQKHRRAKALFLLALIHMPQGIFISINQLSDEQFSFSMGFAVLATTVWALSFVFGEEKLGSMFLGGFITWLIAWWSAQLKSIPLVFMFSIALSITAFVSNDRNRLEGKEEISVINSILFSTIIGVILGSFAVYHLFKTPPLHCVVASILASLLLFGIFQSMKQADQAFEDDRCHFLIAVLIEISSCVGLSLGVFVGHKLNAFGINLPR